VPSPTPLQSHTYGPGHTHSHQAAATEVLPDASPVATVVLDIGDGFGALVIHTPPALDGHEIEIRPLGTDWLGAHTAVRQRLIPSGTQFAAVFGSLPEGHYDLRVRGDAEERPTLSLEVTSATVTDTSWPGTAGDPEGNPTA
jgi:hypothetical protein